MASSLNNIFSYTTFQNLEPQIIKMLLEQYWDAILSELSDINSPLSNILDANDVKNIINNGGISCYITFIHESTDLIEHISTFTKAIGT